MTTLPKVTDQNDANKNLITINFTVHQPDQQLVVEVPKDFTSNFDPPANWQAGITKVKDKCGISLLHATYLVYLVLKCAEQIYAAMLFFYQVSTFDSELGLTTNLRFLKMLVREHAAEVVTECIKYQPQNTRKFIVNMMMNSFWEYMCDGEGAQFKEEILNRVQKFVNC